MIIMYSTPKGLVPCKVSKELIIPQVKGGYRILRLLGFPIKNRLRRVK